MRRRRRIEIPTPVDVLLDPVVQLAAICPICALAALRPEAALAALAPSLVLFNPALNPEAALLTFSSALQTVERESPPSRPSRREADSARVLPERADHLNLVFSRTGAARFRG